MLSEVTKVSTTKDKIFVVALTGIYWIVFGGTMYLLLIPGMTLALPILAIAISAMFVWVFFWRIIPTFKTILSSP